MIGEQKPVAVAMHVQAAHRVFAAQSCDDKMPGTNLYQLTALNQPIQRAFQFIARRNFGAEFANQLLKRRPSVWKLGYMLKNRGVSYHSIILTTLPAIRP